MVRGTNKSPAGKRELSPSTSDEIPASSRAVRVNPEFEFDMFMLSIGFSVALWSALFQIAPHGSNSSQERTTQ